MCISRQLSLSLYREALSSSHECASPEGTGVASEFEVLRWSGDECRTFLRAWAAWCSDPWWCICLMSAQQPACDNACVYGVDAHGVVPDVSATAGKWYPQSYLVLACCGWSMLCGDSADDCPQILRRPHEFKIRCLMDIKALFPPEWNPFYAGFGNRYTDELSYMSVGVPLSKCFIINPKGDILYGTVVNLLIILVPIVAWVVRVWWQRRQYLSLQGSSRFS